MTVVPESIPFIAEVRYQDEAGGYHFNSSDWLFICVDHTPMWVRLDALWQPVRPISRQGSEDVQFVARCTETIWGGISNPYAPWGSATYPSGWRFGDGAASVIVTGKLIIPEPGELWTIAGRRYDSGGNPAIEAYWGAFVPEE